MAIIISELVSTGYYVIIYLKYFGVQLMYIVCFSDSVNLKDRSKN